jgi:maltose O-acetyltransferase
LRLVPLSVVNPPDVAATLRTLERTLDEKSVRAPLGGLKLAWLNNLVAHPALSTRVRIRLMRLSGIDVGLCGVGVWPSVRFLGGHDVTFADGVFVNSGVVFDARARIELGVNVAVGPSVQFITSSHGLGSSKHRAGNGTPVFAPIVVEEGCWIGAGAIVLGGVRVGHGCVIGAGAVVTRDCAPNGLYVGIPAHRERDLPDD